MEKVRLYGGRDHNVVYDPNQNIVEKTPKLLSALLNKTHGITATAIEHEIQSVQRKAEGTPVVIPETNVIYTGGMREYKIEQTYIQANENAGDIAERLKNLPTAYFWIRYKRNPRNYIVTSNEKYEEVIHLIDPMAGRFLRILGTYYKMDPMMLRYAFYRFDEKARNIWKEVKTRTGTLVKKQVKLLQLS